MEHRKSKTRMRLISLRGGTGEDATSTEGPAREVVAIEMGHRVLISEHAEIWTIAGRLSDGTHAKEDIGELSFVLIPGTEEPATAITGYIAPSAPYRFAVPEAALAEQLRVIITQLGYEREGYYLSLGLGGTYFYDEKLSR